MKDNRHTKSLGKTTIMYGDLIFMSNHSLTKGAAFFKALYGIPAIKYGKAILRIGKVVLNSHGRLASISNTSPANKQYITY